MKKSDKIILMADSCSGGLSILKYVEKWSGGYKIVYVADYEKNPFGLKKRIEIVNIVKSWFNNLVKSDETKIVIIACNTASIAIKKNKKNLSKIFHLPVITMIEGVEECIKSNEIDIKNKNVAIMATKYTIRSGEYTKLIKQHKPNNIIEIIATDCEREVACGTYNLPSGRRNIKNELSRYRHEPIDTVILACTCFQTISRQIKSIFGRHVVCLDPGLDVARISKKILNIQTSEINTNISIYNTTKSNLLNQNIKEAYKINTDKSINVEYLKLKR